MDKLQRGLLLACAMVISGCAKQRAADFSRKIALPSGEMVARLMGYQPRGTVEGYLTMSFSPRSQLIKPQITLGHMLGIRAGWLDDHTFAIIYDELEQRSFTSPVYSTGEVSSAVKIITCNRHYVDCGPILRRLDAHRSITVQQFPEGNWPTDLSDR